MPKTPKAVWLHIQGYHSSRLPSRVTWHTPEREFDGRTDDYTLELYRKKGFVLDSRFLEPRHHDALENGGDLFTVRHIHHHPKDLTGPCRIVIEEKSFSKRTPRLVRAIKDFMSGRQSWEGTSTELLSLIGKRKQGIPKDAIRLSTTLFRTRIIRVLIAMGVDIKRRRTGSKRVLHLSSITM